ncbi:hypothetical protein ABK046_42710 [Streptomyces caeruleatus]
MISEKYRKRNVGWVAGAALAALALSVTGCSKSSDSTAKEKPAAHSSSVGGAKEARGKDGAAASSPSNATGQSTAEGAVGAWVTAVIKGQLKEACQLMGQPATDSSPARASTPETCEGDTPEAQEMRDNFGKFRTSFTPKPPNDNPKVEVVTVPGTSDKVVIPADKVVVDGQTLTNIIVANSTGVEAGQLDVSLESTKISDAWYVTNFNFGLG